MTKQLANWEEIISDWTAWLRASGKPETTVRKRVYQIRRFSKEWPTDGPWQVTTRDLVAWTGGYQWAVETRRGYRSSFVTFFRWAVHVGYADDNPAEGLPSIKPAHPNPRPTPDDVYFEALRVASTRTALILRFAAEAGLRRGEIAQIHRRDLVEDLAGYSLVVHGKGRKDRIVPLNAYLASQVRETNEFLFPGDDNGHLSPRYVGTLASRALPGNWTLHSLRHRFATRAYAVDRDTFVVQELLGHASPTTTRTYVQLPQDAKRRLVLAVAHEPIPPPRNQSHRVSAVA